MNRAAFPFAFPSALSFTLALLAGGVPAIAASAAPAFSSEHRCLESTGPAKSRIRLEYRTVYDPDLQWSGAYVLYKGQRSPVTLVQTSRIAQDKPEGRPWEWETTYAEVIGGAIKGRYIVASQGARINGFTYVAPGSGRKTEFVDLLDVYDDDGCHWH